jgi:flagellar biosynthesis/type III secretory pathway protein FliH
MNPFEATAIFVGELIAIVLIALAFHERGRRNGVKEGAKDAYDKGYTQGRKDADNWWLGLETEADKARQQIWREEAQP